MTASATDLRRAELLKKPQNQLTPEEKLYLHGPGNSDRYRYRAIDDNGQRKVVSRLFKAGEADIDGWVDSPALCGAPPTAPSREQRGDTEYDEVIATVAAEPVSAAEPAPRAKPKAA